MKTIRKFLVSSFVVLSFVAYALHEHFSPAGATGGLAARSTSIQQTPPAPATDPQSPPTEPPVSPPPTFPNGPQTLAPATDVPPPTVPAIEPPTLTSIPTATVKANGQYKDGTYTGAEADTYWGLVQIKTVIRNGKIADVQFLEYPSDRRTSQRINSVAMPYLKTEAIQVQNANVDFISGATLTSEAFAQSLQSALDNARN